MTHNVTQLLVLLTPKFWRSVCLFMGNMSRSSVVSLPAGAPSSSDPQGVPSTAALVWNLHHGHHSSVSLISEERVSPIISTHLWFHEWGSQANLHLNYNYFCGQFLSFIFTWLWEEPKSTWQKPENTWDWSNSILNETASRNKVRTLLKIII